jgi:hypothetical protein
MAILDIIILQSMAQADLEKMTKADLIASIVGNQSKTECTKSVDSPEGQVLREFVTKDAAGAIIKTEKLSWTYKETGEVEEITHIVLDGKGTLLDAEKIVHTEKAVELVKLDAEEVAEAIK